MFRVFPSCRRCFHLSFPPNVCREHVLHDQKQKLQAITCCLAGSCLSQGNKRLFIDLADFIIQSEKYISDFSSKCQTPACNSGLPMRLNHQSPLFYISIKGAFSSQVSLLLQQFIKLFIEMIIINCSAGKMMFNFTKHNQFCCNTCSIISSDPVPEENSPQSKL